MIGGNGVVDPPELLGLRIKTSLGHLLLKILKIHTIIVELHRNNSETGKMLHTIQGYHVGVLIHEYKALEVDHRGEK